jgi:PAP2 superfamily
MVNLELSWQAAAAAAACLAGGAAAARLSRRPRLVAAAAFARETALVLGLFALWQLAGSLATTGPDGALARGQWIWHLERTIHMPSEAAVQRAFLPHPLVVQALNLYYASLHFPVLIACLIWLFVWHRRQYRHVRTTLVVLTAGCLLVQLIPVAPPRMLTEDGMVDTAVRYGQSVYGSVAGFNADQLSAMPSVHVGWALLAALVVVQVSRSRWRWLALAYPAGTVLAVTVTANHYWLDGAAAALLLGLVLLVQRAGRVALRRLTAGRRARVAGRTQRRPSYVPDRPPVDA